MTILVIANHDNANLKPETSKVVTAAKALTDDIHVLIVGYDCAHIAQSASKITGVAKVLCADDSEYKYQLAENTAKLIAKISTNYSHVLTASSSQGKDLLPRIAALLNVSAISNVIEIIDNDTFVRPIYAGSALETIQSLDDIKLMTIRSSAFNSSNNDGQAEIENVEIVFPATTHFVSAQLTKSVRPELNNANIVISGGRGLGSKENFALLEQLADKLGAAIGASRAAVDAGFVSNDLQVGQTGKIVAPDLYIAVGISGAIQHLAGMKDAKVIVAINKDPDAPIFQVADYGLVSDLFESVPELINSI